MAALKRIYTVIHKDGLHLVKAAHRSQALNHVAQKQFTVRVATQDDLVKCITGGVVIEGAEDAEQLKLEEPSV